MIQEESMGGYGTGRLYDFMEHRKKKPYFTKPLYIRVGDPLNDTYQLVKNIVYKGKQILAMKKESEPTIILLVEATIENGQLKNILSIPTPFLEELKETLTGIIIF
jgi:hypothetical protein